MKLDELKESLNETHLGDKELVDFEISLINSGKWCDLGSAYLDTHPDADHETADKLGEILLQKMNISYALWQQENVRQDLDAKKIGRKHIFNLVFNWNRKLEGGEVNGFNREGSRRD